MPHPMAISSVPEQKPNGVPTKANPGLSVATPNPSPFGPPSFMVGQFEIPPFLLPIYQACGSQYGIPWEVLASINKIETAFGTNLNLSTAGAEGWMQFMPSTWQTWGVDANGDGRKDPYNPVDAICAAARYLQASGGDTDLRRAIFAYNHASWYVDEVLMAARQYGQLPDGLVGSITGLTEGDRFPVDTKAKYADTNSRAINIYSIEGAPVVAVNDGTVKRTGHNGKLGNYLVLQDNYGNRFTYAHLGSVRTGLTKHPSNKHSSGKHSSGKHSSGKHSSGKRETPSRRLFARPDRANNVAKATLTGQIPMPGEGPVSPSAKPSKSGPLERGTKVTAGTLLGRVGRSNGLAPHLSFAIQPTGSGKPLTDPKPILDGWQLLRDTSVYGSPDQSPLRQQNTTSTAIRDLLMPSTELAHEALSNPRLSIYRCGRSDIRRGRIDRRVLATMNFLAANGFRLTVDSLRCGTSGHDTEADSEHSSGNAMTISKVDGIPTAGHQGPGSAVDSLIKTVLGQQGVMEPDRVTSHEDLPGPVSTSASGKPGDHVDVGFTPLTGSGYQSPFPHAIKGRIDMGVDYVGQGPINAIGNARILRIGAPGWPNGGAGPAGQGVLYKLLDGPQQGSIIYVYEGLRPTVQAGDEVVAGQQIATFYPGSSIEIGFADASGLALAHGVYTEGMVTDWGRKMDDFLSSVGAPGKHDGHFAEMLSPQDWNRVMKQMRHISNPTVRPGSNSEPPAEPHSGPSGPTGPN